jgi:hypothetical protein
MLRPIMRRILLYLAIQKSRNKIFLLPFCNYAKIIHQVLPRLPHYLNIRVTASTFLLVMIFVNEDCSIIINAGYEYSS